MEFAGWPRVNVLQCRVGYLETNHAKHVYYTSCFLLCRSDSSFKFFFLSNCGSRIFRNFCSVDATYVNTEIYMWDPSGISYQQCIRIKTKVEASASTIRYTSVLLPDVYITIIVIVLVNGVLLHVKPVEPKIFETEIVSPQLLSWTRDWFTTIKPARSQWYLNQG